MRTAGAIAGLIWTIGVSGAISCSSGDVEAPPESGAAGAGSGSSAALGAVGSAGQGSSTSSVGTTTGTSPLASGGSGSAAAKTESGSVPAAAPSVGGSPLSTPAGGGTGGVFSGPRPAATGGKGGTSSPPGTVGAGGSAASAGTCAAVSGSAQASPPILEFVIDITLSMDSDAYPTDPAKNASKWEEMQRILPGSFKSLPSNWVVGVSFYNFSMVSRSSGCFVGQQAVPLHVLDTAQRSAIDRSIGAQVPASFTPTISAWQFGLSRLKAWSAAPPAGYEKSPRYIVLITDGVPTVARDGCTQMLPISASEYDGVISLLKSQGEAAGVKTFVVGVLGSEETQSATYDPLYMLSRMAEAGGTATPTDCVPRSGTVASCGTSQRPATCLESRGNYCHYDMTAEPDFAAGLTRALSSVATQAISCDYAIPKPTDGRDIAPERVQANLKLPDGSQQTLLRATDATCANGSWYYSDFDSSGQPTRLALCPTACDQARSTVGASVEVLFTCYDVM